MKSALVSVPSLASASALALLLVLSTTTAQAAILAVNLTANTYFSVSGSDSGTITDSSTQVGESNVVTFMFDRTQPSGTGVLNPFLRIQLTGNGTNEQGYNATRANDNDVPFDEKKSWTYDVLFNSLQIVDGFYNFVLDIGEGGQQNSNEGDALLSLDGLKLYVTNTAGQQDDSTSDSTGDADGILGTLLWNMDADADNFVLLDANKGVGGNGGNGVSDMLMKVPTSVFDSVNPANTPYFILWSRFGLQEGAPAGSGSDNGFEEWAHLTSRNGGSTSGQTSTGGPIPEPGVLGLLGIGLLGQALILRQRRRRLQK